MSDAEISVPALRTFKDGAIAWITIANPARMNALTSAMWESIPAQIKAAVADPDVRVIVLRGEGDKAFSAGADISEFESARTGDGARSYDALNDAAFNALIGCPKPTIAMIQGFCLGGGLGVALCCDMRIADETSQFAIPAARLGIGYNARWVQPILAAVRPDQAKLLLFTGRRFRSADADAMGLISQLVSKADIEATVRALAQEIADNAPLSISASKFIIDEISRFPEDPDMHALDAAVAKCFASNDYAEGRRAFLEKRKPKFTGA
ncbi:enoyl-CoA hydratase [Hyphomicrobium methylovorum]|uniref:enoyl-CoA hydratase n=1 Tax=Hyphomicrobium methylovorum TaxID=84 RepID=UPI0015E66894|nr:enoyl-CoA hydratase [Hyphomicrobium methylovorum]MBA2124806.1 enoyl-CoA hydratase [Hyphomicrobium methylovorum]